MGTTTVVPISTGGNRLLLSAVILFACFRRFSFAVAWFDVDAA
jgi:hypothetical protein